MRMGRTGFPQADMDEALGRLRRAVKRMAEWLAASGGPWLMGEPAHAAPTSRSCRSSCGWTTSTSATLWDDRPAVGALARRAARRPRPSRPTYYHGSLLTEKYPHLRRDSGGSATAGGEPRLMPRPPLPFLLAAVRRWAAFAPLQPALNGVLPAPSAAPSGRPPSRSSSPSSARCCSTVTGGGDISRASLTAVPWWVYLGGLAGMVFVAGGVVIAPVTGALLFFVCIVAGQLLGAMLADHFGAFGLEVREVSPQRIVGLVLVLAGAVLVHAAERRRVAS